ncbi:MAG: polysaccharide biosynthesis/export family protein [Thermoanaerobaculia bacterium]
MKRFAGPLLLGALLLLPRPAAGQESSGDYTLGPKDLLEIRVLELPELNVERRVSDSGSIGLPLLGEMAVSGLTAADLRIRLEQLLTAKYVNRANVSVVVKEFTNKPVSVLGAVLRPGSLAISGRWTLMTAITAAGGLTERAGRRILVLRRSDNGLSDTLEIRTEDLFQSATALWNIPIQPADIVNVVPRTSITVFCLGEVKAPGALQFDSDDRLSLLSVISKAGGLSDRASKTIRVKRQGADGKDVEKVVDFKRIVSGQDPDLPIEPNDVIVVKESFF